MKRKYFMRGMGIGIFVTALLFTIALIFESPSMSEDEIKREAAKLGMVMASDAADDDTSSSDYDQSVADDVKETEDEVNNAAEEAEAAKDEAKEGEEEAEADKQAAEDAKDEANNAVKKTETTTSDDSSSQDATGENVSFTVSAGENSYTVGAHLYRDGLVDDASAFDRFLEQNGYDNRIQNGSFNIPKGSSYEEIAKILTGG